MSHFFSQSKDTVHLLHRLLFFKLIRPRSISGKVCVSQSTF
nr:MAG TPA: hypothetical protein [Caudoviricetes sp.]